MPIEDLTTYTEVDPNAKLTVTATKVTAANLDRDEDAYLYKDFGANHFDGFNIEFEALINATSANTSRGHMGLTVNTVDDSSGWDTADIEVFLYDAAGVGRIYLYRGANVASDVYVGASFDTIYYLRLSRAIASDNVYLYIYSDSARTTLVDTLTVAGYGTAKYRYFYAIASWNDAGAGLDFDGYYQNIDLLPFLPKSTMF
jgi:hypothetical protein